ncbi:MAG: hypothetical protein QOK43_1852 [Acidimicrobiaceae bacterium]|nr:hypothetical protein [Acidimicrobiaceae bacterium]
MSTLLVPAAALLLAAAFLAGAAWLSGSQPDSSRLLAWRARAPSGTSLAVWAAASAIGAALAVASGVIVLGVLTTVLLGGVPDYFKGARLWSRSVDKTKAVAAWARMLSEQTVAGQGLRNAVMSTARRAPASIQRDAVHFASSLEGGRSFAAAAREFADLLCDEEVDVLVGAMCLVSSGHAGDVAGALAELASDCQQAAESRQRSDTNRTEDRWSARLVALISAMSFGVLAWWNRDMILALSGPLGQVVLAVGGGLFVAGQRGMARMDKPPRPHRHIAPELVP